ncbi:tetratricopeptide repeat protein [Stieleria marina]|uniref:tetratricopeptide repeat protein n=1 Tax=Stieleria marina TaxID=1930275 RepID=UPI003AF36B82
MNDAVVLGSPNHSVLKMLGNTLDEVPRVLLRESHAEGDDPISKPNSPEIPHSDSDGRYRLDGEIARGGMGAVLKGRDMDLGRDLAIKVLLDSHKDDPQVIQRFVEEAQIGGQLQHPGIAPVYELGQFADQRPFFSMKLVKGDTLAKLLFDREDAVDERGKLIGIFEQICQTVAYAHSRGVIHRDLKPANIMVGAFGEVQVMDWGLAKVLPTGGVADEKKAKKTQQGQSIIQTMRSVGSDIPGSFGSTGSETQMGSVMGTPAYMPPEQALGEIDQLDQRADVFGLGAILCEILTGKPPYVGENGSQVYRMASRGKLDDAFTRLNACAADTKLITLAKHCLELEPANRPKDASVLAGRTTAYLESVEQKLRDSELAKVDAQVRAEELRRRQRLAYTAGAAIVATLLIGISASLWQMFRANTAEQLAREETARATVAELLAKEEAVRATTAEKETADTLVKVKTERDAKELARKDAEQISTFLSEVLRSPDPNRDGREIKVAELLDNAAKKLETDLADQPGRRVKLQATLGSTFYELGLFKQAIPLREQARDHYLSSGGPEHPNTLAAMNNLAKSYYQVGRRDEAIKLQEEVLKLRRKVSGPEHPNTLIAMSNLAVFYDDDGRRDEAFNLREEVLRLRRMVLGPEHLQTLSAMNNLAISYDDTGRQNEALQLREEILRLRHKVLGAEHRDTFSAMNNLAISYYQAGRRTEAIKLREEVLTLRRKVLGPEHPGTLDAMANLANSYNDAGRRDKAVKLREDVLTLRRKVSGPEYPDTLDAMNNLAVSYDDAGRWNEAVTLKEKGLTLRRKMSGPRHPDLLTAMSNLANSYYEANRRDEAMKLREEVLTLRREVLGPEHPDTLDAMNNLAISYDNAGRQDEAHKLREEVLSLRRKALGPEHPDTLSAMHNLAASYYDEAGRQNEALKLREEVLTLRRKVLGPEHPDTLSAMNNLAVSYKADGRMALTRKLLDRLVSLRRKVLGPEHPETLAAMNNLAILHASADRRDEAFKKLLTATNRLAESCEVAAQRDRARDLREEALTLCRKVLGPEHPDTLLAMHRLAISYKNAGRLEESLQLREEVVTIRRKVLGPVHSKTLEAMNNLAKSHANAGRLDEAFKLREEVLTLNPNDPNGLGGMAWLLATTPDKDGEYPSAAQALAMARRAEELAPHHYGILNTLGIALYRAKEWQETIDVLQKSIKLGGDKVYNWLFIAMAHWQLDQKDEAKQWYDKSLAWKAANAVATQADADLQRFYAEAAKLMTADAKELK